MTAAAAALVVSAFLRGPEVIAPSPAGDPGRSREPGGGPTSGTAASRPLPGTGLPPLERAPGSDSDARGDGDRSGSAGSTPDGPPPSAKEDLRVALEALLAAQRPDGSWEGADLRGRVIGETGTTALAVLGLLGTGAKPGDDARGAALARALGYLRRVTTGTGKLGGTMLEHNIAAYALTEAAGITGDPELRKRAEAAVAYLGEARSAGAWGANFSDDPSEVYEAAWGALALQAAGISGVRAPDGALAGSCAWLRDIRPTAPATRAAALAARLLADPEARREPGIAARLVTDATAADPSGADFHLLYFGGLAAFMGGDETWARWRAWADRAHGERTSRREEAGAAAPLLLLARALAVRRPPAPRAGG